MNFFTLVEGKLANMLGFDGFFMPLMNEKVLVKSNGR